MALVGIGSELDQSNRREIQYIRKKQTSHKSTAFSYATICFSNNPRPPKSVLPLLSMNPRLLKASKIMCSRATRRIIRTGICSTPSQADRQYLEVSKCTGSIDVIDRCGSWFRPTCLPIGISLSLSKTIRPNY